MEKESRLQYLQAAFAIGSGRSGTHFLAELFKRTPEFTALHCDDVGKADGDSYLGYAKWHKLPVQCGALVDRREELIRNAHQQGTRYFEANCYLSLFIPELYQRLHNRFVLSVRNPVDVVNSLYIKGWYEDPVFVQPGYNYNVRKANHSFGRLTPNDPSELERWKRLTRIGRIAWFWNALYLHIFSDLQRLPQAKWKLLRLDELDYSAYLELVEFLDGGETMPQREFLELVERRPGRGLQRRYREDWSAIEAQEFAQEIAQSRELLEWCSSR